MMWVSLIILGMVFLPVIFIFLYFTIFGFLPNMKIPEAVRPGFGMGAMFLVNILLTCVFQKPIAVCQEGIDLGTLGSISWVKAIFLGFLFYFKPTIFLTWGKVLRIEKTINARGAVILKVVDIHDKVYLCTLGDQDKSYDKIVEAVERAQQSVKISDGN